MSRYQALTGQRSVYQLKASWNTMTMFDLMVKCLKERAILEIVQITPTVEKVLFKVAKEQNIAVIVGNVDDACSLPIVYGHHKVYSINKLPDHHMAAISRWDVDSVSLPDNINVVMILRKI